MSISAYYRLELVLQGPVLSQACGGRSFDLDTAMLRYHGNPVLNGSQVRGVLRHSLVHFVEQLRLGDSQQCVEQGERLGGLADRWLGTESANASFEPQTATASFDYFWQCDFAQQPAANRHRIEVDDATGKVKDGSLQVIEDCFGSGSKVTFGGGIRITVEDDAELQAFEHWLGKAIAYVPAIGALKGSGFGKVLDARLERQPDPLCVDELPVGAVSPVTMTFSLEFDRPWCIGGSRPSGDINRIVSQVQVPGSALKAVVAKSLKHNKQWHQIVPFFDLIRFTHAKPSLAGQMPAVPLPLSLASFGKQERDIVDVSHRDHPCYRIESGGSLSTLAFQTDWKTNDWQNAHTVFYKSSIAVPSTYISVRTAVNQKTNTAADSQLFTLECIDPRLETGESLPWVFSVDLSLIAKADDREQVANVLRGCFAKGMQGIGKTKACAKVTHLTQATTASYCTVPEATEKGEYHILLCSDARLLPYPEGVPGCNGHDALFLLYQRYWQHISKGALELKRYFADQEITGGRYLHGRYHAENGYAYQPNWLTKAGSVFVLCLSKGATSDEATRALQHWIQHGLPAAPFDGDYERMPTAMDWQSEPYLPENGYGEVVANIPNQLQLAAQGEEYVDVEL